MINKKPATSNSYFYWNSPKVECYNIQHIQRTHKSALWVDEAKEKLKNVLLLPLIFITRVWVARILGNTWSKFKLVVLEPNAASYACAGIRAPVLATDWDKLVHTVTGQTCKSNTQNRDWVHTYLPWHKIHKVSLWHLCLQPFPPTCHLAMLEHTGAYKEQEGKFVSCSLLILLSFLHFPLNSLSLIPSAPCF